VPSKGLHRLAFGAGEGGDVNGVTCSISRSGNVRDNAAMESFSSSLKTERIGKRIYRKRAQAKADVFDYIERFYNPTCRHSTLVISALSTSNEKLGSLNELILVSTNRQLAESPEIGQFVYSLLSQIEWDEIDVKATYVLPPPCGLYA
jgi:Integrase core domain